MNFLFPFFSSVFQAGASVLDKVVISRQKVNFKIYLGLTFPMAFFAGLIGFLILHPPLFTDELLANGFLLLLVASMVFLVSGNILYYRALEDENLSELQTFDLLNNIPIILFSGLIFESERNYGVIILALIAAFAVTWAHWDKHHLKIGKKTLPYVLWAFFFAPIGAVIFKVLLGVWNPISLLLVRYFFASIIFLPFLFKKTEKVSVRSLTYLFIGSALGAAAMIFYYFGYQRLGVVLTVLIYLLQPLLTYFASIFYLKEKPNMKKIVAFAVVLVAIVIAQFIS